MFKLAPLPYAFDALEPYIDARTMEIHHDKHHQAYVDNLNKALEKYPEYQTWKLEDLLKHVHALPGDIQLTVRNNAGGDANHSFFWPSMKKNGNGNPRGTIAKMIDSKFGTFDAFKEQFSTIAKTVFGSGWAWLVYNKAGDIEIISTPNQDSPIMLGTKPLLGLDVWEHAYYLKYQNKRVDYIQAWWHVINWDFVEQQLK